MKVEETPFQTVHPLGHPLRREVLRHNAYVAGWEHGAADHRPEISYWQTMRELDLLGVYEEGREDGKNARSAAWEKAAKLRNTTGGGVMDDFPSRSDRPAQTFTGTQIQQWIARGSENLRAYLPRTTVWVNDSPGAEGDAWIFTNGEKDQYDQEKIFQFALPFTEELDPAKEYACRQPDGRLRERGDAIRRSRRVGRCDACHPLRLLRNAYPTQPASRRGQMRELSGPVET